MAIGLIETQFKDESPYFLHRLSQFNKRINYIVYSNYLSGSIFAFFFWGTLRNYKLLPVNGPLLSYMILYQIVLFFPISHVKISHKSRLIKLINFALVVNFLFFTLSAPFPANMVLALLLVVQLYQFYYFNISDIGSSFIDLFSKNEIKNTINKYIWIFAFISPLVLGIRFKIF